MNNKVLLSQAIEGMNKYFNHILPVNSSVGTFHYNTRDDKYYLMIWYKNKKIREKIKKELNTVFKFNYICEDKELLIYNGISEDDLETMITLGKLY